MTHRTMTGTALAFLCLISPVRASAQGHGDPHMQAAPNPTVERLLGLALPAAVKAVKAQPETARAALEDLKNRFDRSVGSRRDVPEQRSVRYDAAALDEGQQLAAIYESATGDDRYTRLFRARRWRIEGTEMLNAREYAVALTRLERALAEAERLDDLWLQIITLTNMAYAHVELGQADLAMEQCERARTLAERSDPRSRALTVFNLASVQMHVQRYDKAVSYAREAAELARRVENRLWEGNALLNVGVAHRQLGQLPEARAALLEARDVLLKTRDRIGTGRALYTLAIVDGDMGNIELAAATMEQALPIIRGTDIRHSHDIELRPEEYYNTIEESALRLLASWHLKLGHEQQASEYSAALGAMVAKRPKNAGAHTHRPPGQ